jgi:hypothetical protein
LIAAKAALGPRPMVLKLRTFVARRVSFEVAHLRNPTRKQGKNRYCVVPRLRVLKLRTLVTRRVSEGKTGSASSLAYASGFHFCWKTDSAQLQNLR